MKRDNELDSILEPLRKNKDNSDTIRHLQEVLHKEQTLKIKKRKPYFILLPLAAALLVGLFGGYIIRDYTAQNEKNDNIFENISPDATNQYTYRKYE